MLSDGSSVKGSPEDKQPSGPYIKGSAKISRRVTLALYTGRSQKYRRQEQPPRGCSPIDGFTVGTTERWDSTSQIMEWPETVRPAAL